MNLEEQQIINIFQELLDKHDRQGVREVRDGHTRVSLFGKQLRFDLSKSFPLLTHRQLFVRGSPILQYVELSKDRIRRKYKVHRLVAIAFIQNINNLTLMLEKQLNAGVHIIAFKMNIHLRR